MLLLLRQTSRGTAAGGGRLPVYLFTLLVLAGCASTPQRAITAAWLPPSPSYWETARYTGVTLNYKDGSKRFISAPVINNLVTAKERIEAVSGVRAELGLLDMGSTPNAFAVLHQGRRIISITLGYLDVLGADIDALAITIGHELAHFHLGHHAAIGKEREKKVSLIGEASGPNLNEIDVRTGRAITESHMKSFARDKERAADEQSLRWAVAAGFDPCGEARTIRVYQRMGRADPSIHPSHAQRIGLASQYSRKANKRDCD